MADPIKIMVVEDHHVVRQGLVALLNCVPGMQVVAETADGRMALPVSPGTHYRPDDV
jgi:two-component system NarL family response regulator